MSILQKNEGKERFFEEYNAKGVGGGFHCLHNIYCIHVAKLEEVQLPFVRNVLIRWGDGDIRSWIWTFLNLGSWILKKKSIGFWIFENWLDLDLYKFNLGFWILKYLS